MTIGIAIIGSGIFAREQHLPAVQSASNLSLKAIYSRSLKSAQALATGLSEVDVYSEDSGSGKTYADLLLRKDIAAVILVLPIPAQPQYIRQALEAGKHVLSEKPIAKDMATAKDLVNWYNSSIDQSKVFWGVAENFRFLEKYLRTATEVQKLGGLKTFRTVFRRKVPVGSKYYETEWRKTPQYQGGFVLDGGIHMIAGLRLILGTNDPLVAVSAQTTLQQEYLPPVDTVDAIVKTKNGATGVISLSYGSEIEDSVFEFTCANGLVTLIDDKLTVRGSESLEVEIPFRGSGVKEEVVAFADSIAKGALDKHLKAEEGLADLEVMENLLQSSGELKELKLQ